MGLATHGNIERQTIAADNAGRWMQHQGVTDRFALRVEGLLHTQGPVMQSVVEHGPPAATQVA